MKKFIKKIFPGLAVFRSSILEVQRKYNISILRPLIIFDVGANNGDNFVDITRFPWVKVHAFEPTPDLVKIIKSRIKNRRNYFVNEYAISDKEEVVNFNIAGQGDWGCSSLLNFNDDINETWKGRDDLKFTKTISVNTIKLSTYIQKNNIKRIDFLHIDVQGFDLVALKSLENYIHIVKKGVVEVPVNDAVKLYKGQHSKKETIDFLASHGFNIYKVTTQHNEENLFFKRENN